MTLLSRSRRDPAEGVAAANPGPVDVLAIRRHFTFPQPTSGPQGP